MGDRGGVVRVVQQLISEAEHARPGLARDGIFGPLTKFATMRLQRMWNLEVDGIVGPHTWAALGKSRHLPQLAASAPPMEPTPHPGAPTAQRAPGLPPARPIGSAAPHPVARPQPPPPARPRAPTPPPAPTVSTLADKPGGMDEPRWYQVALAEYAAHQTVFGTSDGNARIHEYFLATSYHPGVGTREAWCSAFANWCMKQAGIKGTNNAAAASWRTWGVELEQPRHGCIMVVHWAKVRSGSGNHVTFFDRKARERIEYFGGNQSKHHAITHTSAPPSAFASVHYRWPR